LLEQLDAAIAERPIRENEEHGGPLVFAFSGQGGDWWGRGRELLRTRPAFRDAFAECDRLVRDFAGWSPWERLTASDGTNVESTESMPRDASVVQPMLGCVQVALSALWKSWGVVPDAVVGHSVGEVAAAHAAGALNLSDAVRVLVERSRWMQALAGRGATAAVKLSRDELEPLLTGRGGLCIAAVNSPQSCVVSGDAAALVELLADLKSRGVPHKRLPTDIAFHSPQMDAITGELTAALAALRPVPASVPFYSTVTGGRVDGTELGAAYWSGNVRRPVRFTDAVACLIGDGFRHFVEIGPAAVLCLPLRQTLAAASITGTVTPSLRSGSPEDISLLGALASVYESGREIAWEQVAGRRGRVVSLPTYAWQRSRHWLGRCDGLTSDTTPVSVGSSESPLLGTLLPPLADLPHARVWQTTTAKLQAALSARPSGPPAELPTTAFIPLALEAARQVFGGEAIGLEDLQCRRPLPLDDPRRRVQITVHRRGDTLAEFTIDSLSGPSDSPHWERHADGRLVHWPEDESPAANGRRTAVGSAR
jgi:acyl transferase domain-containing protein